MLELLREASAASVELVALLVSSVCALDEVLGVVDEVEAVTLLSARLVSLASEESVLARVDVESRLVPVEGVVLLACAVVSFEVEDEEEDGDALLTLDEVEEEDGELELNDELFVVLLLLLMFVFEVVLLFSDAEPDTEPLAP